LREVNVDGRSSSGRIALPTSIELTGPGAARRSELASGSNAH
jgi:hypothetical protein